MVRRITTVAVVGLLGGLLAGIAPARPAEADIPCMQADVRWVGDGHDGRWSTVANWLDTTGHARVPGTKDRVCVDTTLAPAAGVVADGPVAVSQLEVRGGLAAPTFHSQASVIAEEDLVIGVPTVLEGTSPELGTDPHWVCHKAGVKVAAVGALGSARGGASSS